MEQIRHFCRASVLSFQFVAAMIAMEYAVLTVIGEHSFGFAYQSQFGGPDVQICRFLALRDEGLSVFISRDRSRNRDGSLLERVGVFDLIRGVAHDVNSSSADCFTSCPSSVSPSIASRANSRCANPKNHLLTSGEIRWLIARMQTTIHYKENRQHTQDFDDESFNDPAQVTETASYEFVRTSRMLIEYGDTASGWRIGETKPVWQRDFPGDGIQALDSREDCLFVALSSGGILEMDAQTGRDLRPHRIRNSTATKLAVSPCGRYLAVVWHDGELTLSRLNDGCTLWSTFTGSLVFQPEFSPDGTRLLMASPENQSAIQSVESATGKLLDKSMPHRGAIGAMIDDDAVISWGWDGSIRKWSTKLDKLTWQWNLSDS